MGPTESVFIGGLYCLRLLASGRSWRSINAEEGADSAVILRDPAFTQRRGAGGRPHHSEGCSRLTPQDACTFRCVAHATRIGIARIPALGCSYAGGFGPCPCSVTGSNQCALLPKERAGPGHGVPLPFLRKPPPQQPPAPTVFGRKKSTLPSSSFAIVNFASLIPKTRETTSLIYPNHAHDPHSWFQL